MLFLRKVSALRRDEAADHVVFGQRIKENLETLKDLKLIRKSQTRNGLENRREPFVWNRNLSKPQHAMLWPNFVSKELFERPARGLFYHVSSYEDAQHQRSYQHTSGRLLAEWFLSMKGLINA